MDAARPSSAFVVVQSRLYIHQPPVVWGQRDTPGAEWETVECASKKAYGCGKHGQKLVEGLTLYVRSLPDLSSSVSCGHQDLTSAPCVGLGTEASRSIEAELDAPRGGLEIKGAVGIANRHLLVLLMLFHHRDHGKRSYYLVYDSTDESLAMIPYLPDHLKATYTLAAVPVDTANGYELAIMARKFGPGMVDRLCLCTPATRANPASDSIGMWQMKAQRFPELPQPFSADEMFSLGGRVFWVDLSQGLIFCDLLDGSSVVDVRFIKLPDGYEIKYPHKPEYEQKGPESMRMTRTIGCAGTSIKFVCIDRQGVLPGHETVNVWTLDLPRLLWKRDDGFPSPWKQFWKQIGFMNVKLGRVEPQYPTLMLDGAICFLLRWRNMVLGSRETCYICSFDIRRKNSLWFGLVRDYCTTSPRILPCNLFTKCRHRAERKLPSILGRMPKSSPMVAQEQMSY